MKLEYTHQPVLLRQVIEAMPFREGGIYIDGTFGRGGHSLAILQELGAKGQLLAIDKDPQAVAVAQQELAQDSRFTVVRASFTRIFELAQERGWLGKVNGILLDLGVSSPQLDDPDRGFSFKRDGALDMRMDPDVGQSAAHWIKEASEHELSRVFREYGEERYAKRIARAIVKERQVSPITTTGHLAAVIADAHPAWQAGKDPATRCFQAIRIFINKELEDLQTCLSQVVDVLAPGGRVLVISFHSLEDRIVKRFMREQSRGDRFPADLPVTADQLQPVLKVVGKAIVPDAQEIDENPRARSSVLRVAEKL
ncbi:MAG: 16S rRNA (cytosine(1402)-N(4))-methyltransferase RsmH [Gammaproteobacteria bacterium]|nr:16S rRNA (cytosine(1402)-N(4))-methyltransferase RsmH [Gammaproteobacteria bacterium]MDH5800063.1 16S rRNA (cytosine(1402)-N(4))-methyltransferase RsmH [Gammaproteobacteria bacterium]